jgi:hypothetical protein
MSEQAAIGLDLEPWDSGNEPDVLEGEVWKPIPGYEGLYSASNLGRIRSEDRAYTLRDGKKRYFTGVVLSPGTDKKGHQNVGLSVHGVSERLSVHVLVARTFLGPKPRGMIVLHGPNGVSDNTPANLSYGTYWKNGSDDRARDGTQRRGENHPRAKLTEADVRAIRASKDTIKVLSERYGVGTATVSNIRAGRTWTHVA